MANEDAQIVDSLEEVRHVAVRWSAKRLTASDVSTIIQNYGYDNDSLTWPRNDDDGNVVEWEIEVKVRRIGGARIWP